MQFLIDNLSNIITVVSIAAGVVFGYARLGGKVDSLLGNLEQRRENVDKKIDKNTADIDEIKEELHLRVKEKDWRDQNEESRGERKSLSAEIKEVREKQNTMEVTLGEVRTSQNHSLKILERLENHFFENKSK